MAPTKRIASSPVRHAKKARKDPLAEKLKEQLREVMGALSGAEITSEIEKMLSVVLPLSLGEYSDQRHRFQQQVVDGIEGLLGQVEASLVQDVAEKKAARDTAAAEKPSKDKDAAVAAERLTAKVAEVHRLKVALADIATAFRVARSALTDAEEAKVVDGQKARDAEKKKADFVLALADLHALKASAPDDAAIKKKASELMSLLKKYKFEESMMIALPAALAKAPDARGQFDLMAINQLEGEIDKLILEMDGILAAAVPGQAKCDAAIKKAQDHLADMRGKQRAAAKAFDVASKEQSECEATSAAAQKAVRDTAKASQKLEKALHNAEVEVELYGQGPKETFQALQQRVTPPPAPEEEEEVAVAASPAAEAAPVAAEVTPRKGTPIKATPTKEHVELPVAA